MQEMKNQTTAINTAVLSITPKSKAKFSHFVVIKIQNTKFVEDKQKEIKRFSKDELNNDNNRLSH